ncbi:MAG: ABC transporter permease [Brevibacterium sp.]|uniref:ABC transporter permease n=1 Tax=Brevibacterium sp. TaxID=1701 RepID=UPI0026492C26|nr:ABC transporter permease [Brevibacterium sp.]MDN5806900.1 ABC transporter permease [Brevibacterium sp.]MDN5877556.1 ABC transporter permease [Brevibacterium sp.]MDN5907991.1 ABC transporter permease [Brevibacterium sp.]MDN6132961.1 ABC transporter permease [Brevibacterium sp.]MDN6156636.1 ABC transporter permease [Brevibacterium sp.]
MGKYVLRRFVNYFILAFIATVTAYITSSAFMDPAARYRGQNPPLSESSIKSILDGHGTNPDVPILERTWTWLTKIFLHGDFSTTVHNNPVFQEIMTRASVSLKLLLIGSILGAILGVVLGVWGAVKQYKASDQTVTYASYLIIATPTFVIGVILMIIATGFNRLIGTSLIRFSGEYTADIPPGFFPWFTDQLSHMLLPTLALVLMGAATYSRYQRSVMLDVLASDFIRTARSKGRTRKTALVKHGVRVALIPMSTYFAYAFGTLVAGSAMLEVVFSWHGMGEFTINSILQSDINAAAGSVLFIAVLTLISSTLSEVLYAALDPRVRI